MRYDLLITKTYPSGNFDTCINSQTLFYIYRCKVESLDRAAWEVVILSFQLNLIIYILTSQNVIYLASLGTMVLQKTIYQMVAYPLTPPFWFS